MLRITPLFLFFLIHNVLGSIPLEVAEEAIVPSWNGWDDSNNLRQVSEVEALYDHATGYVFYKDLSVPACFVEKNSASSPSSYFKVLSATELQDISESQITQSKFKNEFCGDLSIFEIQSNDFGSRKRVERVRRKRASGGGYYQGGGGGSQTQVQGMLNGNGFFSGQAQAQGSSSQSQVQMGGQVTGNIASSAGNSMSQLSIGHKAGSGQASSSGMGPSNSQVQVNLGHERGAMASANVYSGGMGQSQAQSYGQNRGQNGYGKGQNCGPQGCAQRPSSNGYQQKAAPVPAPAQRNGNGNRNGGKAAPAQQQPLGPNQPVVPATTYPSYPQQKAQPNYANQYAPASAGGSDVTTYTYRGSKGQMSQDLMNILCQMIDCGSQPQGPTTGFRPIATNGVGRAYQQTKGQQNGGYTYPSQQPQQPQQHYPTYQQSQNVYGGSAGESSDCGPSSHRTEPCGTSTNGGFKANGQMPSAYASAPGGQAQSQTVYIQPQRPSSNGHYPRRQPDNMGYGQSQHQPYPQPQIGDDGPDVENEGPQQGRGNGYGIVSQDAQEPAPEADDHDDAGDDVGDDEGIIGTPISEVYRGDIPSTHDDEDCNRNGNCQPAPQPYYPQPVPTTTQRPPYIPYQKPQQTITTTTTQQCHITVFKCTIIIESGNRQKLCRPKPADYNKGGNNGNSNGGMCGSCVTCGQ